MHRKSLFNKSQYVCADEVMYIDYAFLLSTKVYCLWFQMFVKTMVGICKKWYRRFMRLDDFTLHICSNWIDCMIIYLCNIFLWLKYLYAFFFAPIKPELKLLQIIVLKTKSIYVSI